MIITEKQIMQLIKCANHYLNLSFIMNNDEYTVYSESIDKLLFQIDKQQPEKLMEIK